LQRGDSNGVSRRGFDFAAVVAAMIGFLALVVSGYTAYVQRQQVRAQVWPWLVAGNDDGARSIEVYNKGAGPAIVRTAQLFVDDKPYTNWDAVLDALGIEQPRHYKQSTLNPNVLTPSEHVTMIRFEDDDVWKHFRAAAEKHLTMSVCFCSSLDECWLYSDHNPVGFKQTTQLVNPVDECPKIPDVEMFKN
jgi:hypothetical protein